ncbi:hypothetical protein O0444_10580 [Pseudomonas aeruginosa PAO1]|nr:hypothetical protein [Pseudomonas aeruginosa]UVS75454.1 hypothetical protein NX763_10565 [Pseudomonas aeruginosa]UXN42945.1 hypothetical protein N2X48_10580 [Pseudomonas aeruginosa]
MTRALPLLLLALSLPAAATDSESFARRYLAYVHAVGQHSERLWPGWRMADKAFLYSDGRSTWVADAEGRAQRTTAAGDSDPDLDLSYAFPRYRGRPAVLLQISAAHLRSNTGNSETLAAIGPHEAFHRYAQEDWPGLRKPGGYRGDLATLDPRPREYRYALFQSLLQALRTPRQRDSYLSDAQGWLRRWREAAPEESRLAAQVDLSEGTARYIEMAAAARTAQISPRIRNAIGRRCGSTPWPSTMPTRSASASTAKPTRSARWPECCWTCATTTRTGRKPRRPAPGRWTTCCATSLRPGANFPTTRGRAASATGARWAPPASAWSSCRRPSPTHGDRCW